MDTANEISALVDAIIGATEAEFDRRHMDATAAQVRAERTKALALAVKLFERLEGRAPTDLERGIMGW